MCLFIDIVQKTTKKSLSFKHIYGIINESLDLTTEHKTHDPEDYLSVGLDYFRNGSSDSSLALAGNPLFGSNGTHAVIRIPNYQEIYAGEYVIVFYTRCSFLFLNSFCDICRYVTSSSWAIFSLFKIFISTLGEYSIYIATNVSHETAYDKLL